MTGYDTAMKQRLITLWCVVAAVLCWPALALAEDEAPRVDAKFEAYGKLVKVEPASATLLWIVFVLLAAVCIAVLFKDAKRSHLD